jgi:hypothetical protein
MWLSSGFAVAITAATSGIWRYAALGALSINPDIVMDWIFGRTTVREGLSGADLDPIWSVVIILGLAAITGIVGIRKYRSLL